MTTINFKFNEQIESISFNKSVPVSMSDFVAQGCAIFALNTENVLLFQEIPATGELNPVEDDDDLDEILDSSKSDEEDEECSTLTFCLVEQAQKGRKKHERSGWKSKERIEKKEERKEWLNKRKRESFEEVSGLFNSEYGTNISSKDLKIIFEKLDIRPFRFVRSGVLPKGYFKFPNETKKNNSKSSMKEMCKKFDNSLNVNQDENCPNQTRRRQHRKGMKKERAMGCRQMRKWQKNQHPMVSSYPLPFHPTNHSPFMCHHHPMYFAPETYFSYGQTYPTQVHKRHHRHHRTINTPKI